MHTKQTKCPTIVCLFILFLKLYKPRALVIKARGTIHNILLEFSVVWSTWERYHVADVRHTCHKEQQTLKAESEA